MDIFKHIQKQRSSIMNPPPHPCRPASAVGIYWFLTFKRVHPGSSILISSMWFLPMFVFVFREKPDKDSATFSCSCYFSFGCNAVRQGSNRLFPRYRIFQLCLLNRSFCFHWFGKHPWFDRKVLHAPASVIGYIFCFIDLRLWSWEWEFMSEKL